MISFPDGRTPVVLSAHAEELIAVDAHAILRYLDRGPEVRRVAAALLRTRRLRRHRAVVRAANVAELSDGLRALVAGDDHPLVARSSGTTTPRTTYVLPGQGSQWPAMGADAYRELPAYRAEVDKCAAAFVAAGAESPLAYLKTDGDFSQIQTQAAQFTHAAGLAQVWRSCGIPPEITVGHSLGEVAAAYIAGTITLADAAAVVIARAQVVDGLPGRYGMAVLGISVDEAERLINATPGWLELSVVNAGSSVVVSGDRDAIVAIVSASETEGRFAREIAVNFPAHTSALEPLRSDLVARLPRSQFVYAPVHFIGSATGSVVAPGTEFANYWYQNLRYTVRFDRAIAAARQHGAGRFIELSAHPALLFALGDLVGDDDPVAVGSGRRDESLVDVLSGNIAVAAVADPDYRWSELVDFRQRPLTEFPNAPMHAVHLWATPEPLPPLPGLTVAIENWEAKPESEPGLAVRRVAVLELTGPVGALTGQLRDAIDAHATAQLADSHDADMLVAVAPVLDHPDTARGVEEIARLLELGLLDYAGAISTACRDVWLVTVGGEHVLPDEPVALPAQAALAAMHRSIGFEHPDQTFRHLDLTSWDLEDAATVVEALLGDGAEVAVRDGGAGPTLYVQTLSEADPAEPWRLDAGLLDNVVITGGSGAVGMHYARYLAGRGARRIVLLSRNGADAEAIGVPGVELVAPQCDITSADQLRAATLEYGGNGASLVIHAAGAATFAPRAAITGEAFTETIAAKVAGLARITELWPLRSDARILVCSSVSGVWGGKGHAAYSAANRMLDVMAGQLRAEGRHCVSARYGLWGAGIIGADEVTRIERSGLLPMAPHAAIEASLRDHQADPLILAADRGRLQTFFDSRRSGETADETAISAVDNAARVRAELAAALSLGDAAAIDLSASLLDLGVDSLLALDLRKRLRRATGRSVPLADLLGGITGDELIASLGGTSGTSSDERSLPLENSAEFRAVRNVRGHMTEGGHLA
jgi:mycobactin polyketide synthetase MbtD